MIANDLPKMIVVQRRSALSQREKDNEHLCVCVYMFNEVMVTKISRIRVTNSICMKWSAKQLLDSNSATISSAHLTGPKIVYDSPQTWRRRRSSERMDVACFAKKEVTGRQCNPSRLEGRSYRYVICLRLVKDLNPVRILGMSPSLSLSMASQADRVPFQLCKLQLLQSARSSAIDLDDLAALAEAAQWSWYRWTD